MTAPAPDLLLPALHEGLPELGDLTQVSASVPSTKGTISVDVQLGPPFTLRVLVPPTTRGVVGIPIDAVTSQGSTRLEVTLGGTVVFSAGSFRPNTEVSFVGIDAGYVKFALAAGMHAFSAREL